jgi:hypothetical protein
MRGGERPVLVANIDNAPERNREMDEEGERVALHMFTAV